MSKKSIIKGTILLTITGILTKLLGFYNRIFLTNTIGVYEIGIYQMLFPIYVFAFSICGQGISTALSKQIAFYNGKNDILSIKKVFHCGTWISFILSFFITILFHKNASFIACHLLKNPPMGKLLSIMILVIPFVCVKACFLAYFIGTKKEEIQGIVQLVEQIVRIGSMSLLVFLPSLCSPTALTAVYAVIIGELFAFILTVILYFSQKNKVRTENKVKIKNKASSEKIFLNLQKDALPLTINSSLFSFFTSFEATIIPAYLYYFYQNKELAIEIYGTLSGIVIPFLLFPATIVSALQTMLLPTISFAKGKNDNTKIRQSICYSILFCFSLGIFSTACYLLFGTMICNLLFHNKFAGSLLVKMCFLCPLIYSSNTLSTIQTGMDFAFRNLLFNIGAVCIRICFTIFLIPLYGINAYIYGMLVSYLFLNIAHIISLLPAIKNK